MSLLNFIDLMGTFVFALSGTTAGIRKGFDFFGVFVLAFVTAVGGGVLRDVVIGATPPAGLIRHEYLVAVAIAVFIGIVFQSAIIRMEKPTRWLDAIGLGFFAAFGAERAYYFIPSIQLAIVMGGLSAVGGGCIRDVLAGRSPIIFSKEIYASAALVGACIAVLGPVGLLPQSISVWLAIIACTAIRVISMHYQINFPIIKDKTPPQL